MPTSDAQKKASAKWDRENMTIVACRVTRSKAERFRAACKALGTVPNQVLLKAVDETINQAGESGDQE